MFTQSALSLLLQLFLVTLAVAHPTYAVTQHNHNNNWAYGSGGGVVGFIILVLDVIVFLEVLKSTRPVSHKLAWCLLVFFFPIGGIIIYWLFSNRTEHMGSGGYESIA